MNSRHGTRTLFFLTTTLLAITLNKTWPMFRSLFHIRPHANLTSASRTKHHPNPNKTFSSQAKPGTTPPEHPYSTVHGAPIPVPKA